MALDNNLAVALAGIAANLDQSDDDFIDADITNNTDQSDDDLVDFDDQSTNTDQSDDDLVDFDDQSINTDQSDDDLVDFDDQSTDNSDNSDNSDDDLVDLDAKLNDSFNTSTTTDDDNNGSNRDNDYSTDTDVDTTTTLKVSDALNGNGDHRDNNNGDDRNNDQSDDDNLDLDLSLEDAFNIDDDDIIDIEQLTGSSNDILTAGGDLASNSNGVAVFGDGNAFEVSQANDLADGDVLHNPNVSNGGLNVQGGFAEGGKSEADSDWGDAGEDANVAADAISGAEGEVSSEAFTQNIVMGSNVQYNSVDMSVVGGSGHGEAFGDDA